MKRLVFVFLAALCFTTNSATAQPNLRISPFITNLSAQPGTTQRVKITLQNPTNKPLTVKVIPRDFEASPEQNGEPQLLASNTSPYSLANWLSDSNLNKQVTIPANQSIEYEAVFRVPFSIMPKTYFGSVTFTQDANISVGSLVFITVGNPDTKYFIEDLVYSESNDATKPHGIFTATLSNASDALITPIFRLRITGKSGAIVTDAEITDQGSILPDSKRKYMLTPSRKLPEELLTATLSATDQNGVTSDKSLQLDRNPTPTQQPPEEQINPNDYTWMPLTVIGGILTLTTLLYLWHRKSNVIN